MNKSKYNFVHLVCNKLLNLPTQKIVTVTFVRSTKNVKCPVLSNNLINTDSVHELLKNSVTKFLAYTLSIVSSF